MNCGKRWTGFTMRPNSESLSDDDSCFCCKQQMPQCAVSVHSIKLRYIIFSNFKIQKITNVHKLILPRWPTSINLLMILNTKCLIS